MQIAPGRFSLPVNGIGIFLAAALTLRLAAAAEAEFPALHDRGALEIRDEKGGRLQFLRIAADRSITLRNVSDMVIFCSDLRSIRMENCRNVRVENCLIHDSAACGIELQSCENVRIQGCRIERVASALYALESSGIQFVGNYVEDVAGPMPRGQMVQFDKVRGSGNRIQRNYAVAREGRSHPEDLISIYQSRGEPGAPILIEDNYLCGDPGSGSRGKSPSGSGIMLGDGGGGRILCRNNVLLSPGQAGIGVAGGADIAVEGNRILGTASDVSNVGLYVWNQSGEAGGEISVSGNRILWTNKEGRPNGWWNGGGFSRVIERGNDFEDRTLPQKIPPPPSRAPMPPAPVKTNAPPQLPWQQAVATTP